MKRLHVHVRVSDLETSVRFYSTMFGAEPTVRKSEYAKWMMDDPSVNFAISIGEGAPGLSHLGIQTESGAELAEVAERLRASGAQLLEQKNIACCYALGDKEWVTDPSGIRWESFHTFGESDGLAENPRPAACCAPKAPEQPIKAAAGCCGVSTARE